MAWNVDRRKMYAHVYFDLSANTLGLAVYAIGKIPGFSGALSDELKQATQASKAYDLFLKTLGKEYFTKEELQLGKRFNFHEIEDKLKKLDILGKLHAEDPDASVVVNLDDPLMWFNSRVNLLSEEKQARAKNMAENKKKEIGKQIKAQEFDQDIANALTPEEQQEVMQRVYPTLARGLNPKSGPKDFPGKKSVPPTFITSKEFDVAYYPGFKGAQYMTKTPKSLEYVHPQQAEDASSKWHHILVPDTKPLMGGKPLSAFEVEPLDYASEVLARLFFYKLSEAGEKSLTIMDFNKAIEPVTAKAKTMLKQISEPKEEKTASSTIGTWIDLHDGRTYDSEAQVIAAKTSQAQSEQERLPLAAKSKINKLAQHLLQQKKFKLYARLMKEIR